MLIGEGDEDTENQPHKRHRRELCGKCISLGAYCRKRDRELKINHIQMS